MAKSKSQREKRSQLRKTVNWAAKFHQQYAVVDEKVYYCLAYMHKGKAALQALSGDKGQYAKILTEHPERFATDGDIVIARLAGELSPSGDEVGWTSCKALRRKIQWWRERNNG